MAKLLGKLILLTFLPFFGNAQLFSDDFGSAFSSISTSNWPSACRGGTASSFNTSVGPCAGAGDYAYSMSGFGSYITTSAITIPTSGYELTFSYSFNNTFGLPSVEIRTGASCGTTLQSTATLSNTSGTCTNETINLNAFAGQTIYIRFISNTSSATFYIDDPTVDTGSGSGSCLLEDDFGTAFTSISTSNWPSACRGGTASSFNTSTGGCAGAGDYNYSLSGFGSYITSMALSIPSTGYELSFNYAFNNTFSFPSVQIRTGASCGTTLAASQSLTNTSGACNPMTINLNAYAGQTIYIRFVSNTSSATFYLDDVSVCAASAPSGDFKWADNFNDNNTSLNYAGLDGDEACTGCGTWTLAGGASLDLVPSGGWNGNTNETEAFPANMANVYYVRLDRNEYIESPTIDMSSQESLKISFYAKSSSSGTGGGDTWSFSDRLRLQIWDGSSWITVQSIRDDLVSGWSGPDDFISAALPFNYFCFTAYKSSTSPGNYYYSSTPNVDASYFHSDFKFRVIFEGGFSGSPFAWVDDFTFRADADGYSTMIPCGLSFWNQPSATGYGQDLGTSGNNNAEKGVELELDNSISFPPDWSTEADDGDQVSQVFGSGESERVVFAVISEQEINFSFPAVYFYAPSMGWQSSVMSKDNTYTGPGWRYYAVEYISCDLAGGSIAEPTNDFRYYYSFEYGNEFMPVFYHLNTSGIEYGGGATSTLEVFNAPDVESTDNCGIVLPVELLSFYGETLNGINQLYWSTASEHDNSHFTIERSDKGIEFTEIGTVQGQGNSSTNIDYTFTDYSPINKRNYYRLKQVDFSGDYSYSNVIVLENTLDQVYSVYPNPAKDRFTIESKNKISFMHLYNNVGQNIINECSISGDDHLKHISIRDLPHGMYFLETNLGSKKIIIQ